MTTETTNTINRKPTHRLYQVTGEGEKSFWRIIGAGWQNKDGLGVSLSCEAVPLQGRLVLRVITPKGDPNQRSLV